jgi:DNA-binding NarL/FixJ family response regulator
VSIPASLPIRVMVVDDHAVVREGLAKLLAAATDVDVVAEASGGEDVAAVVQSAAPDVILMDLSMPDVDGVEATRRALSIRPETKVVMLTSFSDPEQVNAALDAGAVGYVLKDAAPEEIVQAVKAAGRGEAPFSSRAASALLQRRAQKRAGDDLTPRERQVLELVGQGLANKQISRKLGIKEKTVKAHLTSVFQRIGVADRTSAALWASKNLP